MRFRLPAFRWLAAVASLLCLFAAPARGGDLTFEKEVRPILKANCFQCHGEDEELKGELDLRLVKLMERGGESGPAILKGNREESPLYRMLADGDMPPKKEKRLKPEEIEVIGRWIDGGTRTVQAEPETLPKPGEFFIAPAERQHWAFRPIEKPAPPTTKDAASVRNPIDAFVGARLEEKGLSPSPEADPATLIRRACFDLTGLPPSPEEVSHFVEDYGRDSEAAMATLIDRLLESPHYGEHWGRHWLDVAGYADSEGYNDKDTERPDAWRYRDYVIRAFDGDKPWDEFIVEQLAGDELVKATHANAQGLANADPDACDKLTATGFLRMAPDGSGSSPDDPQHARNATITETLKIVSSSLLGLTIGCAECHDHRFDPIPQEDFYRMRAIFAPVYDTENWRMPNTRRAALLSAEDQKKADELEAEAKRVGDEYLAEMMRVVGVIFERELLKIPEAEREFGRKAYETEEKDRTPEQVAFLTEKYPSLNVRRTVLHLFLAKYEDGDELKKKYEALNEQVQELRGKKPQPDYIRVATEDTKNVPATRLFHRGDFTSPEGDPLPPGGFEVLDAPNFAENDPGLPTTGRRLAYARYLTSGEHPLVARVLVNRFWMNHFGRGLVTTPGEFGARSAGPSHPELLDWLAADFMENGWSLKRFHRQILMSRTWRQASGRRAEAVAVDADNTFLWRMPVRRLEAETVRDAMLAVSGGLNGSLFGAPVPVSTDDGGLFAVGGGKVSDGAPELRRSVYVQHRRTQPVAMLQAFDVPQMEPNCERRVSSTVATQALELMNGEFSQARANEFAKRVRSDCGENASREELVRRAWTLAFGANPGNNEISELTGYLEKQESVLRPREEAAKKGEFKAADAALASLCQVLFETNRFLYVE
ncbi:MAG: PSD1 domain-containing protein [Verrucomicrobiae bacterium]|nr:PSD1 domain-containing protein [Verrucomicrobiae bacterium]